jgi:hypothetical protein
MAAMKLYFGENPVGGEVDLVEFEQLQTDVEGKYDKGDPSALDGGVMQYQNAVAMEAAVLEKFERGPDTDLTRDREYDNAALMEKAIKGNTTEIDSLNSKLDEWLANDKPELIVELQNLFPKYTETDDDQTALMYDSAAKMGIVVAKNEQDIVTGDAATLQSAKDYADLQDIDNLTAAKEYADTQDAATLAAANTHSDANDAVTLKSANDYTDEKVAAIPGIDGLEDFEDKVEELDQNAVRNWNMANDIPDLGGSEGVKNVAVLGALPDTPDANTLYIITG